MEFFELLVSRILTDWLIIVSLTSVTGLMSQTSPWAMKINEWSFIVRGYEKHRLYLYILLGFQSGISYDRQVRSLNPLSIAFAYGYLQGTA